MAQPIALFSNLARVGFVRGYLQAYGARSAVGHQSIE